LRAHVFLIYGILWEIVFNAYFTFPKDPKTIYVPLLFQLSAIDNDSQIGYTWDHIFPWQRNQRLWIAKHSVNLMLCQNKRLVIRPFNPVLKSNL
jgi:hypothetical protein